jgi:hypothetical protein
MVVIAPGTSIGVAAYVIPFGTVVAFVFGVVARRDPARQGRRVAPLGGLAVGMSIASLASLVVVVFCHLLGSSGQMWSRSARATRQVRSSSAREGEAG